MVFDFADDNNDTTYSVRSINVTLGNECYVCHADDNLSGITVELFYFANEEHDIHSLYANGIHLFTTEQSAAALDGQGEVQVERLIGPEERMDQNPIAYEYNGDQTQNMTGNPWGDVRNCDIDQCREQREERDEERD